jgi:SAM-dependent methyltransferase
VGTVYAVDRDARAIQRLEGLATSSSTATVVALRADFADLHELPELDGALMANSLHFVRDQAGALRGVVTRLRPGGRLVLVEYEGRRASPWLPFPVPLARFERLAAEVGLSAPTVMGQRPSRFGGELYAAVTSRSG